MSTERLLGAWAIYRAARRECLARVGRENSNYDPLCHFAEALAASLLGGNLAAHVNQPDWDIELDDGTKVQVKCLANRDDTPWTGGHTVLFPANPQVTLYVLVVVLDLRPSSVLVFHRERMGDLYDALGATHPGRGTRLDFYEAKYRRILASRDEFAGMVDVIWPPTEPGDPHAEVAAAGDGGDDGGAVTAVGFPSGSLREWCRRIRELLDAPREGRTRHRDGFCQCEVYRAIEYAPAAQRAQLASGIFWSVWIDQVMWYVLVEGGVGGRAANRELYEAFAALYPFPKLYSHPVPGHASPAWLLAANRSYQLPSRELLLEDKEEFWGDVASWLESIGRSDVRDAAIFAFKEDLGLRFPPEMGYLFAE